MKNFLLLAIFLAGTIAIYADVYTVHVMTVRNGIWFRCAVLDEEGKDRLLWIVHDLKSSDPAEEKKYPLPINHENAESLIALLKNSTDFKKNNQRRKNGGVGLGPGFIVAFQEGEPPDAKNVAIYDLPPDMQSPDLDKLKVLIRWEEIQSLVQH